MDDYIKREDVINALNELCERICPYSKLQRGAMCVSCTLGSALDVIEDELPAADVREIVRGEWILHDDDMYGDYWECSNCHDEFCLIEGDMYYNFCPNCGADMRKEVHGDE